jgi:hypothetical protein
VFPDEAEALAVNEQDQTDETQGDLSQVEPDSGDTGVEEDIPADPDDAAADEDSDLGRVAAEEPPPMPEGAPHIGGDANPGPAPDDPARSDNR